MAQIIKTTFKFRRNLASYWAEKNPVLAEGEPCFELDTGKLKIGNGTTAYNDLPYINSNITKAKLSTDVQISLDKADTAIQQADLNSALEGYVAKNGTDRLMTAAEGTKLEGIETGAQANVIETVKVGGKALTVTEKAVDIAAISTDLLTQGTEEIIFNCGSVD